MIGGNNTQNLYITIDNSHLNINNSNTLFIQQPEVSITNPLHNFNNISSSPSYYIPPLLKKAQAQDKGKDFHKKLQGKLDNLMKKKDYQLLLELTKSKIAQTMTSSMASALPFKMMLNKNQRSSMNTTLYAKEETQSKSQSPEPYNNNINTLSDQQNEKKLIPGLASLFGKGGLKSSALQSQMDIMTPQIPPASPTAIEGNSSSEGEDEEGRELQILIAEGEGKLKPQTKGISYVTGTKSILCKRFIKLGQCPHGNKCEYAHSKKELQFNSPSEWVELVKNISQQYQQQVSDMSSMSLIHGINASDGLGTSVKDHIDTKYLGEKHGINGIKTMMESAKVDDYRGVEFLIKNGANPIAQDFKGYDALYYAVINNSLRSIQILIEYAGDKMPTDRVYGKKKRNILTIAALYSHDIKILDYLVNFKEHGVKFNANQTDRFQRNAIFYSLFRNKLRGIQLFVQVAQCSLDIPDLHGKYLIDYALHYNFEDILLEIVKGGARLGVKQKKGIQILMYAAQFGNFELIKALMSKNVSLTSLSEDTGYNCIMTALQAGKTDLIKQMLEYIVNMKPFNQQCRDYGETFLMKCVSRCNLELTTLLLNKSGIQLGSLKDQQGKTELIHAVEKNFYEGAKLILDTAKRTKQDLDMNHYDKRGRTALIHASINQNAQILKLLLFDYQFPVTSIITNVTNANDQQQQQQQPRAQQVHVIKWKDELGRDVCDYAQQEDVKLILAKYIEKNSMLYNGYFEMMNGLTKKIMVQKQKESFLTKVASQHQSQQVSGRDSQKQQSQGRMILDVRALKQVQIQEKQKQKSMRNKLKKIEDQIAKESELMKQTNQDQTDEEKIQILQQISKKRLKQLRSIAIRFPKLTNLENNPKFKQAIKQLYEESNLSKYITGEKRRSVDEILEHHSPSKVLERYQGKRMSTDHRHLLSLINTEYGNKHQLYLPKIKSHQQLITVQDQQPSSKRLKNKNSINIKETLVKIFSEDQLPKFKTLADSLDKNLELESSRQLSYKNLNNPQTNSHRSVQLLGGAALLMNQTDYLPKIDIHRNGGGGGFSQMKMKLAGTQSMKNLKEVKFDDSDLENELEEEAEDLIEMSQSKSLAKQVRKKIEENFK